MPTYNLEYLNDLKRDRDVLREQLERVQSDLRRVSDVIEAMERLHSGASVPVTVSPTARIQVEPNQFKDTPANYALATVMVETRIPYRARDLADALYRGGQGTDATKVFTMVKHHLKAWRGSSPKYAELDQANHTWVLTEAGRTALAAMLEKRQTLSVPPQPTLALQR